MRFKTDNNYTPMRLLIEHMPGIKFNCYVNAQLTTIIFCVFYFILEMAEVALSHCVCANYNTDSRGHRRVDHITYLFEFIDDFDVPYSTIKGFLKHTGLIKSTPTMQLDDQSLDDQSLDGDDVFTLRYTGKDTGKIDSNTVTRLQPGQDDHDEEWMQSSYNAENHVLHLMVSVLYYKLGYELFLIKACHNNPVRLSYITNCTGMTTCTDCYGILGLH